MATAELVIDGVISSEAWWGDEVTPKQLNAWLAEHAKAKELTVRLNSPGGDALAGMAMHAALKRMDARIVVEVEGIAASAASVIAMAGDEIRVHQGAQIMIHEAWTYTLGNAKDLRKQADVLEGLNKAFAELYATRSGQAVEHVLEMMADETWMGGKDAVRLGFADVVIPAKAKPQQSARAQALMSTYKRVPESLREQPRPRQQQLTVGRTPLGELARAGARIGDK